ncbi:unnamed protein product, partial [Tenebrio molitor]
KKLQSCKEKRIDCGFLPALIPTALAVAKALGLGAAGYAESNGSLLTETSLTSASHTNEALIRFQEFYNLPTDGTLNQKTLAFISKP